MAKASERVSPAPGGISSAAMMPMPTPNKSPKSRIMMNDERIKRLIMDNLPELEWNIAQVGGDCKDSKLLRRTHFSPYTMSDKNYYVTHYQVKV